MILEMKNALEDIKSGDKKGYRKLYNATYEEVYSRSFLIIQDKDCAVDFMKDFYKEFFGILDEADDAQDQEKWLWQKYYRKIRRQYQKLLAEQKPAASGEERALAELPASLPLLHRIMLVMTVEDNFKAREISRIFGLEEEKIQAELGKLDKLLPALAKNRPASESRYFVSWSDLLSGASEELIDEDDMDWVEPLYKEIIAAVGITDDTFEYFVADVDLSDIPSKKTAAVAEEEEESEYDDEDEYEDEDDEDDEDDDEEYDDEDDDEDDDDEDDDDEEDDDEDDGRYDWDLEDDGRKMIIVGVIIAFIIVLVVGFGAYKFFSRDKGSDVQTSQVEEESEEETAELIIKGDTPSDETDDTVDSYEAESVDESDSTETDAETETPEESTEPEEVEESTDSAETQTVTMIVTASSSRVRSEANTTSSVVASVTSGEKVEVIGDTSSEWVQIRCIEQNNEEGYMMSQYLKAAE